MANILARNARVITTYPIAPDLEGKIDNALQWSSRSKQIQRCLVTGSE